MSKIINEYQDENNLPVLIVEAENYIQAARYIEGCNYVGAVGEIEHIGQNRWKLHYSLISDRMVAKGTRPYVSPEMRIRRNVTLVAILLYGLAMFILIFGRM